MRWRSGRAVLAANPREAASVRGLAFDATSSLYVEAHGEPPLDGGADVLCWMDHRGEAEAEEIGRTGDRYLSYIGGSVSPEMHLPKLLWLKRHRPWRWARVTAVRDLCDELARRATGVDRHSVCGLSCKLPYLPADQDPWRRSLLADLGIADLLSLGRLSDTPGRVGALHGDGVDVRRGGSRPARRNARRHRADRFRGRRARRHRARLSRGHEQHRGADRRHLDLVHDLGRGRAARAGRLGPLQGRRVSPATGCTRRGRACPARRSTPCWRRIPAAPARPPPSTTPETARAVLDCLDAEGPAFAARRHVVPDWLGNRAPLGDGSVAGAAHRHRRGHHPPLLPGALLRHRAGPGAAEPAGDFNT